MDYNNKLHIDLSLILFAFCVRPQENTKEDSEWKCESRTMACTTSDSDQLFFPLVSRCKSTKFSFHACPSQIRSAEYPPRYAPCAAARADGLIFY